MKNLVYIFLFIAFCIGGCSKYTAPTSWQLPSEERSKYPTWQISGMETKNILYPDNSFKWKLEYRDKEKDSSFEPYVFCIPIASQYSLQLNISSKKGTPVLLLSDRKSNSFDMQSILSKNEIASLDSYPGRLVGYSIGKNKSLSYCFSSETNRNLTGWLWLINGEYSGPSVYEKYVLDSLLLDSLGFKIDASFLEYSAEVDSIIHHDDLQQIWNNSNITNIRKFKDSKVDISLVKSNCESIQLKDHFYEKFKELIFFHSEDEKSFISLDTINYGYNLMKVFETNQSAAINYGKSLNKLKIESWNYPFEISPEKTLEYFTEYSSIFIELYKREQFYKSLPDTGNTHEYVKMYLAYSGGITNILSSSLSLRLSEILVKLGGLSAAIYDTKGYLVASTSPLVILNINDQPGWDLIINSKKKVGTLKYYSCG